MDDLERARAVVDGMMRRDAFSQWLGLMVLHVEPGRVDVAMTVRDDMVNGFAVAHGGIAFSLADSAMAFAANTHGAVAVALDNTITYPKAVRSGERLHATAVERSATARTAVYDVTVERVGSIQNETVALFRGTVYRTKKEHELD